MTAGSVAHLVDAIARYLAQHPGAADSEEGITNWWLPTMGIEASSEDVRRALEALMHAGRVEQVHIASGQQIWRLKSG